MFVAMNNFPVNPDRAEDFEKIWRERESYLEDVPGFVHFVLLAQRRCWTLRQPQHLAVARALPGLDRERVLHEGPPRRRIDGGHPPRPPARRTLRIRHRGRAKHRLLAPQPRHNRAAAPRRFPAGRLLPRDARACSPTVDTTPPRPPESPSIRRTRSRYISEI